MAEERWCLAGNPGNYLRPLRELKKRLKAKCDMQLAFNLQLFTLN